MKKMLLYALAAIVILAAACADAPQKESVTPAPIAPGGHAATQARTAEPAPESEIELQSDIFDEADALVQAPDPYFKPFEGEGNEEFFRSIAEAVIQEPPHPEDPFVPEMVPEITEADTPESTDIEEVTSVILVESSPQEDSVLPVTSLSTTPLMVTPPLPAASPVAPQTVTPLVVTPPLVTAPAASPSPTPPPSAVTPLSTPLSSVTVPPAAGLTPRYTQRFSESATGLPATYPLPTVFPVPTQTRPPLHEIDDQPPALIQEPVPSAVIPGIPYPSTDMTGRENEDIVFSRVVRAVAGQVVEVPYRGTGWVYLGETGARRGVSYDSRRQDTEGQSFIFRVEAPGVYILKFYRQDFIRNFIINDYVQIIAGEAPETASADRFGPPVDRGRVVAEPRWPGAVDEAAAIRGGIRQQVSDSTANGTENSRTNSQSSVQAAPAPYAAVQPAATPPQTVPPQAARPQTAPPPVSTVPQPVSPSPVQVLPPASSMTANDGGNTVSGSTEDTSPALYLEKAGEEFKAGRIASAISFLDQFREYFPSGSDEAWWLYGQCYEANSPARDILAALDYYRRLVQEYPQSSRSGEARRRIPYLERYYINIR